MDNARNSGAGNQRGMVYVEYSLVTLVLVVFLFAPVPGGDSSIVDIVMDSLRNFYRNSSYLLSLP